MRRTQMSDVSYPITQSPNHAITTSSGQSTVEVAILVAVVAAALVAMQVYVKATASGRWKAMADTFGGGQQYEPGVTTTQ